MMTFFCGIPIMNVIDKIQRLYETQGSKPYGEEITQIQHSIQVAKIAESRHASDALIAAGLLHDIGHLLYDDKINDWKLNDRHEMLGASLLKSTFGKDVSEPVKLHVMAKRYLCGINDSYYEDLSEASKDSLALQGGPIIDRHKQHIFENNQYFDHALELRYWDDEGKDSEDLDSDFSRYIPLLKSLTQSK